MNDVDAGPTLAEETELRHRWEIHRLHDLLRDQTENADRWREMYDHAIRRLGIFHPYLAEITEEDAFRLWEMDVS